MDRSVETDIMKVKSSTMPPDIVKSKSEEITDALKRLATLSSNYHPQGKALQSTLFERLRDGESIRVGQDDDDLSSPTVSCVSFSDDDFSLENTVELLSQARNRQPLQSFSQDNDDISISSINTHALKRIEDLKMKLEIQENTKLELLNQCMRLETELEKIDSNFARASLLKAENSELREQTARIERDFMNEMGAMMKQMKEMEEEYEKQLLIRDRKIEKLEEDIQLLQITKNVDPPSVIAIPRIDSSIQSSLSVRQLEENSISRRA